MALPSNSVPFRAYRVALPALRHRLAQAPPASAGPRDRPEITLPLPDGRLERFQVVESSVLAPTFRAEHPELRTYLGIGRDHSEARLDVTPRGVRAIVFTPRGVALLDPLEPGATDKMKSSWVKSGADGGFDCQWLGPSLPSSVSSATQGLSTGNIRKTFRFVLLGTGQYTQALGGVSLATAEMVTSVNRLNAIFEREVAVHLELVEAVAFPDSATDPYPSNTITGLVSRNVSVADSVSGGQAYDISQVVTQQPGPYPSGGALGLADCDSDNRATSAVLGPDPSANWFMLKIMAHEVSHNLGATHTQDADCQRDPTTPYETGSGTTIMSYAGKCPPYDVETWADPYFHAGSIDQMVTLWPSHPSCGAAEATGNSVPVANAGADYTIPRQTPFLLAGDGFDPDPWDSLTYCWEEMDKAATSHDPTNGPLFRSRPPSPSATRAFPALATLLAGGSDPYEQLPTVDRAMRFRLTVRDNHPGTGGQASDDAVITVSGAPFAATSPHGGETYASDAVIPVTWSVGGGAVAATVDLLLSPDGGQNWTLLQANTPNDGSQAVSYHAAQTAAHCRIKVQAVGNIFYAMSDSDFAITGSTTAVDADSAAQAAFALGPAIPNPSRGGVAVDFALAHASGVDLTVVSLQGRNLKTLASGRWPAGRHRVLWQGDDAFGRRLPSGVYFLRGAAEGVVVRRRVVLFR